ncbi:MAG: zinc-binding dehydrogenase [Chthonomonadales bacterium]|nr:zinc-binding dehydrogenase [Chthonomonadales bacterium]
MSVRAAIMEGPGQPVRVVEMADPVIEPGAVALRTLAAEVCGTDVHLLHGRLSGVPYPIIPGHVSVGAVEETGGAVTDVDGQTVRPGDVVTFLDVHETCHACWHCLVAKLSTRCPKRKVYGITYSARDGLLGGWSQRIYLKPGVCIVRLPREVTPDLWIAAGCGLPTALHAVDLAALRIGDRVLVQGAGPVGLSACALAQASGAGWVGVVEGSPIRRQAALRMGADQCFDPAQDLLAEVASATRGRGPDVVIEASGNPAAVRQGCEMARDGGRYVIVGQYTDNGDVEINPHAHINRKHLTIQGCWGSDLSHIYRGAEALARLGDRFPWVSMISRRYSLDQVNEALSDVEHRRVVKAVIVP